jgi:hypothetical protein
LMFFWIIATVVLTVSIFGLLILLDTDGAWMSIPKQLLNWK